MSRTPLFRLLQRSYRAASYSVTHAEPVDELLDRAGVSGWFRKLLDVAYTRECGLPVDRQSSLNLLLLIDGGCW
jgi:hypothetical protein